MPSDPTADSSGIVPEVYTVAQVAIALSISERHAWRLIARDELPVLRLGRRVVVPKVALTKWMTETALA